MRPWASGQGFSAYLAAMGDLLLCSLPAAGASLIFLTETSTKAPACSSKASPTASGILILRGFDTLAGNVIVYMLYGMLFHYISTFS